MSVMLIISLLINFVLLLRDGDTMSSAQCYDMLAAQKKAEGLRLASPCPVCKQCPQGGAYQTDGPQDPPPEEPIHIVNDPNAGSSQEIGFKYGTELVAEKTDHTSFDPNDKHLQSSSLHRYARSPILKGAMKIQVGSNRFITLDEASFAYDIFYEQHQIFQYTNWLGVYCQQDPSDAFAIQDLLWRNKPDLIIEIGTNTGGGAIYYASIMRAYNMNGKIVTLDVKHVSENWNKKNSHRCVGCVTADKHPWWNEGMINFIQGDILRPDIQKQVEEYVANASNIFVVEDASHRYPDTLKRMNVIYKYVKVGGYMLVQDTKMDRFVHGLGKRYGNLKFGPMRSVDEFLDKNKGWAIDRTFEYLMYSQHHRGYLKRLK
jgi:cephalosporin hydroxylase